MHSSLRPALEHLATYQAVPKRMLSELLRDSWNRPDDNIQALLDYGFIKQAGGKAGVYILGPKGRRFLGYKRLDYEPSRDSVSLSVLKHHVIDLLSHGNWQLDENDQLAYKGDLAFNTPNGGRAYVRCTLKDISVAELKLMVNRYVQNPILSTEKVVITAERPERYRDYLEKERIGAVHFMEPSIYKYLDA